MRLTNRDIQVIEFLKEFRVASTSDLMELFGFTQPSCNRRMRQLMEEFRYIKKIEYNPTYNFYNDKYKAGLKNHRKELSRLSGRLQEQQTFPASSRMK